MTFKFSAIDLIKYGINITILKSFNSNLDKSIYGSLCITTFCSCFFLHIVVLLVYFVNSFIILLYNK